MLHDSQVMLKVTGWDTRSSSTVLHMNCAFVSSFLAEYSRTEEVVDSPVMGSTSTEAWMEVPTQEMNNTILNKKNMLKTTDKKNHRAILTN